MYATSFQPLSHAAIPDVQFILIVEDEKASRSALSQLLQTSGYTTRVAESAEDAMRLVRAADPGMPAIALVDFNLPGIDGLELINRIHQLDANVFTVLVTANESGVITGDIDSRHFGYLRKPIDFDGLLHLIREHLQPAPKVASPETSGSC
jgi:DNA-binding NtrC family response regulator